jgi:hypothetical protein
MRVHTVLLLSASRGLCQGETPRKRLATPMDRGKAEEAANKKRSYWIPGSWHLRLVYTHAIPFHDPSQESNRAGEPHEAQR